MEMWVTLTDCIGQLMGQLNVKLMELAQVTQQTISQLIDVLAK